jgi:quercetin dioxygenase-like cupin family protein
MRVSLGRRGVLFIVCAALLTACGGSDESAIDSAASSTATASAQGPLQLLDAQEITILDQRVEYPTKKPARITSDVTVLEPGQETGWRRHRVPVYVYVLEGTYTVEYDAAVTRDFPAGTAFIQAIKTDYNGMNKGTEPVRLLTVYLGAKGLRDIIER